jgi:hypothetical protein
MKTNKMLSLEFIAILPPVVIQSKSYLPLSIFPDERKVVGIIRELESLKFRSGNCKYFLNWDSTKGMASCDRNC